jgi:hypothetical protein
MNDNYMEKVKLDDEFFKLTKVRKLRPKLELNPDNVSLKTRKNL